MRKPKNCLTDRGKAALKAFLLVIIVALAGAQVPEHLSWNESDSVKPRLFFLVKAPVQIEKGDYVIFTPKNIDPYINGKTLVKKVTCNEGDTLTKKGKDYFCNGNIFLGKAKDFSLKGERLRNFIYNGIIPKGFCFVSGSDKDSYDSRYWGFLRKNDIEARAYPVF